ncbi:hypothetical protein CORT_0B03130 [Candida orthopsilosis Co 90-125]|uniref:Signal recognition particle subunit SRP14 n=1 Tax=Candida orthopsilosis (strain 90-125) TaxID=1136231 RepID=H8X0Y5_CANO9|nr:hypothetical protein CORT_0B03130 [Candida orthopsilosis Co 90-125]CCG22024.1 hypothetical protein CORT_0B03130 [Candida orthopsilosis Co 90-125]
MTRLDNSQFLKQLNDAVTNNNGKSSIYLTQKRLASSSNESSSSSIDDLPTNVIPHNQIQNSTSYPILVRISMNSTNNKDKKQEKLKLSTVVETDQLNRFWQQYIRVLKNGFVGLKKKEKKKNKKSKVTK